MATPSIPSLVTLLMTSEAERLVAHLGETTMAVTGDPRADLPSRALQEVHPSWIAQQLEKLPPAVQAAAFASLPSAVRSRTASLLTTKPAPSNINPSVMSVFLTYLWMQVRSPSYVPVSMLPDSPLRRLLTLNKTQLVRYIDLVAMWDLVPEMQRVIDKSLWAKVQALLTPEQQRYLAIAMRMQSTGQSHNLLALAAHPDRFKRALHERGLARLASIFGAKDGPILWHLTRRLDTGRGRYLEAAYEKLAGKASSSPRVIDQMLALITQVQEKP
jgi:hypothetical protein